MSQVLNLEDFSSNSSSDPEEEQKNEEINQNQDKPKTRLQWGGFGKKKPVQEIEEVCPYKNCGRKFVSTEQLTIHIDRRHKAVEPPKQELVSTPIPTKSKVLSETPKSSQSKISQAKSTVASSKDSTQLSTQIDTTSTKPSLTEKGVPKQSFQGAKPRPVTAHSKGGKVAQAQAQLLMQLKKESQEAVLLDRRPKTAATTSFYDETRIKDKLKYLESLEDNLNVDIESILKTDITKTVRSNVKLTKQLVLDNAMCEELGEVNTLMLRDKGLDVFDDVRGPDGFKMVDLFNIECLLASHNKIKDLFGISQLNTLIELNLSFNEISDLTGLENLTLLESLHLNRNQLTIITPIEKLKALKVLQLYHNRIVNANSVMQIMTSLPKLRELSLDGNPCASKNEFNYELMLRIPKLKLLNDDAVKEMDRDVASQYLEMHGIKLDLKPAIVKHELVANQRPETATKKQVTFQMNALESEDHRESIQNELFEKSNLRVKELEKEVIRLKTLLKQNHFDEVYKENDLMKRELMSMQILMEENQDLKDELERLRSMKFDDRAKIIGEENVRLRRRNGELLIQNTDLNAEINQLKKEQPLIANTPLQQQNLARPQTAQVRSTQQLDSIEDVDKELSDLLSANQKRLSQLHQEFKQISKVADEPYINVRKLKTQPSRTPGSTRE